MRSFFATGLALLVGCGWAASAVRAQTGPNQRPAMLPLPPVSQVSSGLVPTAYTTEPTPHQLPPANSTTPTEQYNSAFATSMQAHQGQAVPTSPPPTAVDSEYSQALEGTCWENCDSPNCSCNGGFFAAGGGIVMTRNRANAFTTTYDDGGLGNPVMNTQSAGAGWAGGGQVTLGYAFGGCTDCGAKGPWGVVAPNGPAVAVTWWGLGEMNGFAQVNDTSGNPATALSASFDIIGADIGGETFADFFDGAQSQRLWRTDNANNIEVNMYDGSMFSTPHLQIIGLAGFRYFRFSEQMTFGSLQFGETWGANGGTDEAYLRFRTQNNMYGGQLGAIFNFRPGKRLTFFITPKVGLFGNDMQTRTQLFRGDGLDAGDFTLSKQDFSLMADIEMGMNYAVSQNWSAWIGYRALGITNVALADEQFMGNFGDLKQSGSLIMHGGFAGLLWNF